jgi:hypothetical protein
LGLVPLVGLGGMGRGVGLVGEAGLGEVLGEGARRAAADAARARASARRYGGMEVTRGEVLTDGGQRTGGLSPTPLSPSPFPWVLVLGWVRL